MATESIDYVSPDTSTKVESKVFPRPGQHTSGIIDWLTTIDHKKIGLLYGLTALFFLLLGGLEALLIRSQLWSHNMDVLSNREYNQMFYHAWHHYGVFGNYASKCCIFQLHHAFTDWS